MSYCLNMDEISAIWTLFFMKELMKKLRFNFVVTSGFSCVQRDASGSGTLSREWPPLWSLDHTEWNVLS